VPLAEAAERLRIRGLVALERIEPGLAQAPAQSDRPDIEIGEIGSGLGDGIRDQDADLEVLAQRLDAGGTVHGGADGGIVETLGRADIADAGRTGVDADADRERV
jgi:hypothetical protein